MREKINTCLGLGKMPSYPPYITLWRFHDISDQQRDSLHRHTIILITTTAPLTFEAPHPFISVCMLTRFATASCQSSLIRCWYSRHGTRPRALSTQPQAHASLTWQDVEEPLGAYQQRGYALLSIGDSLGEYRVLRKLGWGNYSTVWLVQREA